MDVRKTQNPQRSFGPAPTAVWSALRKEIPLRPDPNNTATKSSEMLAAAFVHNTDPAAFYSAALPRDRSDKGTAAADRCGAAPRRASD
jgi:histidine ammonia-lyase